LLILALPVQADGKPVGFLSGTFTMQKISRIIAAWRREKPAGFSARPGPQYPGSHEPGIFFAAKKIRSPSAARNLENRPSGYGAVQG